MVNCLEAERILTQQAKNSIRKNTLSRKIDIVRRKVRRLGSALVAFSGGVDSTVIARICREELGNKATAVTFQTPDYPQSELANAKRIARVLGIRHIVQSVPPTELSLCKGKMYEKLKKLADAERITYVVDGAHEDDKKDKQLSFIAARAKKIKSPLLESRFNKKEVRNAAKLLGLPNWDKRSSGKTKKPLRKIKNSRKSE